MELFTHLGVWKALDKRLPHHHLSAAGIEPPPGHKFEVLPHLNANRLEASHCNVDTVGSVYADQVNDANQFERGQRIAGRIAGDAGFGFEHLEPCPGKVADQFRICALTQHQNMEWITGSLE